MHGPPNGRSDDRSNLLNPSSSAFGVSPSQPSSPITPGSSPYTRGSLNVVVPTSSNGVLGRTSMGSQPSSASGKRSSRATEKVEALTPWKRFSLWTQKFIRKIADSHAFSAITTVLTIYALFGDDMRLIFTEKPQDWIFDVLTIMCMAIFSLEIVVLAAGKAGYLFGFFFWLDIISTVTLVLDVTYVNEEIFGDQISQAGRTASANAGNQQAGESAEAARAARMSRAGTKAGRVARLIRIVRLIRLIKVMSWVGKDYNSPSNNVQEASPGDASWENDEDDRIQKESAVSKKLSEMTTRRVIVLVLIIMLVLPMFETSYFGDDLPTSAQFGLDALYRSWTEGMTRWEPWSNATAQHQYLTSRDRRIYESNFLQYLYYHNWFCPGKLPAGKEGVQTPQSSFGRLFWAGTGISSRLLSAKAGFHAERYFMPGHTAVYDWDQKWNGAEWDYYQCDLPSEVRSKMKSAWQERKACVEGSVRGISLIDWQDDDAHAHVTCPEDLRYQERELAYPRTATIEELEDIVFLFVFDKRSGSSMQAALNAGQTFFICFLLGFGAMTFSNDANKLVLTPIERMIAKLDKLRSNPLEAMSIGAEEQQRDERKAARQRMKSDDSSGASDCSPQGSDKKDCRKHPWTRLRNFLQTFWSAASGTGSESKEPMETVVLEKTIIKIGSLLALGFGEAGAEIIGQNMRGSNTSALNAMIPGRKVEAIFGFCDIRHFTDATEVLQDQVMVFVNTIAGVVHSCINEFFGSPNKNIGDAFLLVWRLSGHDEGKQQRLADMSVICFTKIIAQVNKSKDLAEYRNHPKLVKRLPNYRVRMGFGLHSGWAIEGAIGSEFKIDASYLSPNVNMAARLEGETKDFGCLILISDSLHKLMSPSFREECRLIDNVLMSGTTEPFALYTMDLDDLALAIEQPVRPSGMQATKSMATRHRRREEYLRLRAARWEDSYDLHRFFSTDPDIVKMRARYSEEFFCRFNMAYLNYEAGEWEAARALLKTTRFLLATEDGPSAALMRFLKSQDWTAPKTWPGYRLLS
eukprot:TRINITY_DN2325_c0_g2_i1.p1 TRINITY_DN2325_c0_g2~~TRINITY_DN2325_c0_g2_i1.p1  ORF type:complete len:1031 (+),score=275.50 TRINITY_DN2325_c0_g2_i1:205-3297(+)